MRRTAIHIVIALCFLVFAPSAMARVGADIWRAQPYDNNGLSITAKAMEFKKGKLWLKLQFINSLDQPMSVNPDQIQAKLATGATMTRAKGVFDKLSSSHAAKVIQPGAGEEIAIEYEIGEVDRVALQLNFAITVNGKVKKFPEWVSTSTVNWAMAEKYQHSSLNVTLVSATNTKGGVELKLKVDNRNDAPIYIDKKLFKVKLPSGSLIDREKTLMKNSLTILGHAADEFSVEFKIGDPPGFAVVMDGINNGVLGLPELPIKRL